MKRCYLFRDPTDAKEACYLMSFHISKPAPSVSAFSCSRDLSAFAAADHSTNSDEEKKADRQRCTVGRVPHFFPSQNGAKEG